MNGQGNLLLAIVLSLLILLGFQYFFEAPEMKKEAEKKNLEQVENFKNNNSTSIEDNISGYLELDDALNKDERIKIDTLRLQGSISLKGLKIDDLTFKDYKDTLNTDDNLEKEKNLSSKDNNIYKFCPSCGNGNENNYQFCINCGNDLQY